MESSNNGSLAPRDVQQYVWGYFELHANQRMSVLKFFITLAAFMATGMFAAFERDFALVGFVLGGLLSFTSFIFHKLDRRTQFLIKHSECALQRLERDLLDDDRLQLFAFEERSTIDAQRERHGVRFWNRHLTYGQCLRWLFWLFGLIGLIGLIAPAASFLDTQWPWEDKMCTSAVQEYVAR